MMGVRLDVEVDTPMIRSAMADAHMSQSKLAGEVGISQPSLSLWLSGKTSLFESTVMRIEDALGVPGALVDRGALPEEPSGEGEAAVAAPSPEVDVSAVLVVTPEPAEQVAADVASEPRAVIEDRAMQLFALDAVERSEYERVSNELAARESELDAADAQLKQDAVALDRAKADLEELRDRYEELKHDAVKAKPELWPRFTVAEFLDARDRLAETVKNEAGEVVDCTHFMVAERLMRDGLVDMGALLTPETMVHGVAW